MIKWFKIRRLEKRLEEFEALVQRRRGYGTLAGPIEVVLHDRDWRDFLDEAEQREHSFLARRHFDLTGSIYYFNPKTDAVAHQPNSPKAFTSIGMDRSVKVKYEYGDDGRLYKYVNGVRDEDDYGVDPESFFGNRLAHPELWEMSTEEVVEQLHD